MLNQFCKLLDALGDVENGVECVLTESAFDALHGIVKDTFGWKVARVFENQFTQREDGSLVLSSENASQAFRDCVNSIER